MVCLGLKPGRQDGRRRWIRGAMATCVHVSRHLEMEWVKQIRNSEFKIIFLPNIHEILEFSVTRLGEILPHY